jgi:hypothetical protein
MYVILSPSLVILSEAKNLLFAQGKLREGSLAMKVRDSPRHRTAGAVSVAENAPSHCPETVPLRENDITLDLLSTFYFFLAITKILSPQRIGRKIQPVIA